MGDAGIHPLRVTHGLRRTLRSPSCQAVLCVVHASSLSLSPFWEGWSMHVFTAVPDPQGSVRCWLPWGASWPHEVCCVPIPLVGLRLPNAAVRLTPFLRRPASQRRLHRRPCGMLLRHTKQKTILLIFPNITFAVQTRFST